MEIYVGNLEFKVLDTPNVYTDENGIIFVEVEVTDRDWTYILRYSLTGKMPEMIEPMFPYFDDEEFDEEDNEEDDEEDDDEDDVKEDEEYYSVNYPC